ncbi:hypothetical protein BDFG_04191 [Blastomyces dermatitidis ATCC 26199]|nr:hypothetical protein BDFG_04191 [Blastomyces dermatitidis ATCC 26199]
MPSLDHAVCLMNPSDILQSEPLLQLFEAFFVQGPLNDSLKLLQHLTEVCQSLPTSQPSRLACLLPSLQPPLSPGIPSLLPPRYSLQGPSRSSPQSSLPKPQPPFSSETFRRLSRNELEHIAREYFTKEKGIKNKNHLNLLVDASTQFVKLEPVHDTSFTDCFWGSNDEIFPDKPNTEPNCRLEEGAERIEQREATNTAARRLILLYRHHLIEERQFQVEDFELEQGIGKATIALRQYAHGVKRSIDTVKFDLGRSRHYLKLLEIAGPGNVLFLNGTATTWERSLKAGDPKCIVDFRDKMFPFLKRSFQNRDLEGAKLIINGLLKIGWSYEELSRGRGRLMSALFRYLNKEDLTAGKIVLRDDEMSGLKRRRLDRTSSAKRPCPGLQAKISKEHQSHATNECQNVPSDGSSRADAFVYHMSMQVLVAAATSVASTHDSAKQQNIDTMHRSPPPPPAGAGFTSSPVPSPNRMADSRTITEALPIAAENAHNGSNVVADGHQDIAQNRADGDISYPLPFNIEEIRTSQLDFSLLSSVTSFGEIEQNKVTARQDMNGTETFQSDGVDQCLPQIEALPAADVDDTHSLPSLDINNGDPLPTYYDVDSDEWVLPPFDVDSDEWVLPPFDVDGQNLPEYLSQR